MCKKDLFSKLLIVFLVFLMVFENLSYANAQSYGFQPEKEPAFGTDEPLGGLEEPYDLFRRFSGNETPIWVEDEELPSGAVKPFAAWLPSHPDRQGSENFAKDPCNQQTENGNIDDVVYWFDVGTNYEEDRVRVYAKDNTAILLLFAKVFSVYENFDIWNLNISDLGIKPVDIGFTYGFQQNHPEVGPAKLGLCIDSNVIAKMREMMLDKAIKSMAGKAKEKQDDPNFTLNNPEFVEEVLTEAAFDVVVSVSTGGLGKILKFINLAKLKEILSKLFKKGNGGVGDKIFDFGLDKIESKIKSTILKPFVRAFMDAVKADEQLAKLPIDEAIVKWGENSNQFIVNLLKEGIYVEHEDPLHRLNTTLKVSGQKLVVNWSGNQGDASHVMILRINKSVKDSGGNYLREYAMFDFGTGVFTDISLTCGNSYVYWISASNNKQFNKPDYPLPGHGDWTRVTAVGKDYVHCGNNSDQSGGGSPAPACTIDPATKGVILYSGLEYAGSCMLATASISSFAGSPLADNSVSSVRVNGDYRLRFYEDPNYTGLNGRYHEVSSSQNNLDITTLGNQISSVKIEEVVKCDTTKDGVYLYKNSGYDGSCYFTTGDISDLGSTPIGDNSLSSIKIVGDYETKLYEDKGFAGRSEPISKSDDNLNDHSLGEQYSSVKVWKKTECNDLTRRGVYVYSNYNYSGNCVFVAYGSPDPNFGDIVAMYHVRSFKLVGVDCIKLYEHRNYGGRADRVCSNKVQRDYNYRIWGVEPWMRPLPLPPPNTVIFNAEGGTFDIGYSNYSAVKISVAVNGNTADIKYRPDCFKPIGVFDTLVDPDLQVGVHNHLGYPNWRTEAQDEIPGNGRFDWNLGMDQLGVNNAVVGELYCNIVAWDAKQGTGENTETEMADANGYMYIHVTVNQTLAAPVYVRQCLLPANGQTFDVMPDLCWNNPTGYKLLFDLFKKSQAGTVTQILGINWTNSGREAISYNEAGVYGVRYAEMNMTTKKWFYYNGGAISWFTVKNASSGTGLSRSLESIPALEQSPIYVAALYLPLVMTDASTSVEIPQSEEQIQQNVELEEKQPTDAKPIEQSVMTVQIFLPIVAND